MIKKFYHHEVTFEYENFPVINTSLGDRKYQPDIWITDIDHKNKRIYLNITEINGLIHSASKHQLNKTRLRRESITEYFKSYKDKCYPNYDIIFSYIVFEVDEFLYNKIDYFLEIFERYFSNGGVFPSSKGL